MSAIDGRATCSLFVLEYTLAELSSVITVTNGNLLFSKKCKISSEWKCPSVSQTNHLFSQNNTI